MLTAESRGGMLMMVGFAGFWLVFGGILWRWS